MFRCGAVSISLASDCFSEFFVNYKDIGSLLCKWSNSTDLNFCSVSKGPGLDYLSFAQSCGYNILFCPTFKTIDVISKYGAWRNTVKIIGQVFSESRGKASFENVNVIQGDPMLNFSSNILDSMSKADVVTMMKSVKDDTNDEVLKTNLKTMFLTLKTGAIFFCIETKPTMQKIIEVLSFFSGEMLYGPTPVNIRLDFDALECYKFEFGCGPILSARGMFFVWEKKSSVLPANFFIQKPIENQLNSEKCNKNICFPSKSSLGISSTESLQLQQFVSPMNFDHFESSKSVALDETSSQDMAVTFEMKIPCVESHSKETLKLPDHKEIFESNFDLNRNYSSPVTKNSNASHTCFEVDKSNFLVDDASILCSTQPKSFLDFKGKCDTLPKFMVEPTNIPPNYGNAEQTITNSNPQVTPFHFSGYTKASDFVSSQQKKESTICNPKSTESCVSDSSVNSVEATFNINNSTQTSYLPLKINEKSDIGCVSESVCSFESKNQCIQTLADPQSHQIVADKLSDLRHKINDLTQSVRKMLQANTFQPCENKPKSYQNFVLDCCHASGHEYLHVSNFKETRCICLREPIRFCCNSKQCSTRNCFENKHLCPSSKRDLKFHYQSPCSEIQSAPVQTPNLVIPLDCLSEEALSMIIKPMFSKIKKD